MKSLDYEDHIMDYYMSPGHAQAAVSVKKTRSGRAKTRHAAGHTKTRRNSKLVITFLYLVLCAAALYAGGRLILAPGNLLPDKYYGAEDFGIETIYSPVDFNANGVDDYTDIVTGARQEIKNNPTYDGSYHAGGYPPAELGVCTDVVWRAFQNAGYCLKDMVDADIAQNPSLYAAVKGSPDPNIDFRRVPNLKTFFERYAQSLTLDPTDYAAWQPGDIVTYGTNHIAIVSNRRNEDGRAYILHNGGQAKEADELTKGEISGHFRFDASQITDSILVASMT